jgi:hypothetical protein
MSSSNPEICKKEPEVQLDKDQKNMKSFENEDKKKDWSVLSGFWKMLWNFIDGQKMENPSQKSKAEDSKRDAIINASNIMNDKNLDPDAKRKSLERLFRSFQENKDAFPQNTDQKLKSQVSEKEGSEKFLWDLMNTIGENRLALQEMNVNFAKNINQQGTPPGSPETKEWREVLNDCLKTFP